MGPVGGKGSRRFWLGASSCLDGEGGRGSSFAGTDVGEAVWGFGYAAAEEWLLRGGLVLFRWMRW